MKRTTKRLLAAILSLLMLMTLLPSTVLAESSEEVVLKWQGAKTDLVIFNSLYTERTFALTVKTTGNYAIYSESNNADPWLQIYDEDDTIADTDDIMDPDYYDLNFYTVVTLEAGKAYSMLIGNYYENAATVSVTVESTTEDATGTDEVPSTGVTFEEDSWMMVPGNVLSPGYIVGSEESAVSLTSSDPAVVKVVTDEYDDQYIEAVGTGSATLTITAESGATDTMTITVKAIIMYTPIASLAKGDIFWPDYIIGNGDAFASATSSDPAVVNIVTDTNYETGEEYLSYVQAVDIGSTTLTVTTESGATDTITITVEEARTMTADKKLTVSTVYEQDKAYKFIPKVSGTYAFQSFGDTDAFVEVYDKNLNLMDDNDDSGSTLNFYLEMDLTAGETYYAVFGNYADEATFDVYISHPVAATTVTLYADVSGGLAKVEKDTYYVYTGAELFFAHTLGDTDMVAPEEAEYTVIDTSVVDWLEEYYCYVALKPGTTTATVTTENGLTDTLTIVVIDKVEKDFDYNGVYDGKDLDALYAAISNSASLDGILCEAEINGDNKINLKDIKILYEAMGADSFTPGDVDADKNITANDALMALQMATGKVTATATQALSADVDADDSGVVSANDALMILQYATQKISQLSPA